MVLSISWGSAEDLHVLHCKQSFSLGCRFIWTAAAQENVGLAIFRFSLGNQSICQGKIIKEKRIAPNGLFGKTTGC